MVVFLLIVWVWVRFLVCWWLLSIMSCEISLYWCFVLRSWWIIGWFIVIILKLIFWWVIGLILMCWIILILIVLVVSFMVFYWIGLIGEIMIWLLLMNFIIFVIMMWLRKGKCVISGWWIRLFVLGWKLRCWCFWLCWLIIGLWICVISWCWFMKVIWRILVRSFVLVSLLRKFFVMCRRFLMFG